jgi:multiple sugar transport system substrate-binding protein
MNEMRMSRRDFLRSLTAVSAISLLSACAPVGPATGTGAEEAADISTGAVDTAVRSGGIQYEQLQAINNQEPITLEVWDWHTPRIDMWNRWYPQYRDLYPNVEFNVTQVPFAEYEKKLPASIPAGQGPDMFFLKWSFHPTLVAGGMVAPYPEELFPRQVVADWFEGFPMNAGPEGKVYWLPVGVMSGGIFRNMDLWEEAGLTDDDIPETWDEVVEVAKLLTKFDSAGRMTQSGLDINGAIPSIINYLIYQQGAWMFNESYTRPLYDRDETRKALQYFLDLYDVHQVCDRNFLPWMEAFGTGSAGMVFAWSWYSGYLNVNSPDIPYMVSRCPTWTGDFEPAVGPGALDPESFAVPVTTPTNRMQVAFDAIQWLFSQDEFLVEHIMTAGSPPGAKQIQQHEKILENQTIRALLPQTPYVLTVLGGPPLLGDIERQYLYEGVFQAGMSIDDALQQAQSEGERIMQSGEWTINEREYNHASLMQPPVQ